MAFVSFWEHFIWYAAHRLIDDIQSGVHRMCLLATNEIDWRYDDYPIMTILDRHLSEFKWNTKLYEHTMRDICDKIESEVQKLIYYTCWLVVFVLK